LNPNFKIFLRAIKNDISAKKKGKINFKLSSALKKVPDIAGSIKMPN